MSTNELNEFMEKEFIENPVIEVNENLSVNIKESDFNIIREKSSNIRSDISPLNFVSVKKSLRDYLHEEVLEVEKDVIIRKTADYLIECLDDNGYFKMNEREIADKLSVDINIIDKALELIPDVVIMDIGLPTIDGIEATKRIKSQNTKIKVLMYTSREDEDDIFDSFKAGADGYITKGATSEQTVSAVLAVSEGAGWLDPAIAKVVLTNIRRGDSSNEKRGEINYKLGKNLYGLTEREMEVLALIVDGLTNPQIAEKLVITISTTKTHVHSILQKLYVNTRSKAISMAMKEGLV